MASDKRKSREAPKTNAGKTELRNWGVSLAVAAIAVAVLIAISATVNPLFGRYVHWDWMAGVAPVSFTALALAIRRRWV
jgi:hypothetical protein